MQMRWDSETLVSLSVSPNDLPEPVTRVKKKKKDPEFSLVPHEKQMRSGSKVSTRPHGLTGTGSPILEDCDGYLFAHDGCISVMRFSAQCRCAAREGQAGGGTFSKDNMQRKQDSKRDERIGRGGCAN